MKLRLATLLCGLLLAASCTSGTEGIFASIEREEKIISHGGLNTSATVTSMAEFGGKYYAAGGAALFSRATSATNWDKSAVGGSYAVASVAATTNFIYAVAAQKLYRSGDGTSWVEVALSAGAASGLVYIRDGSGVDSVGVLVVTNTANVYFIDSSGTLTTAPVLLDAQSTSVHSAVYDNTNYYLANRTTIWQVAGTTPTQVLDSADPQNYDFGGLIYINNAPGGASFNGYYISTRSKGTTGGGIYRVASLPATPTALSDATDVKVSSSAVDFGSWLYNSANHKLWLGTLTSSASGTGTANGYMEVSLDSGAFDTTPDEESHNYTSSVLPTASVRTFFRSSSGQIFLGTSGNGLWVWDSASKKWSQQ